MHHLLSRPDQRGVTTFWGISIILIEAVVVFFVFYVLYFFWIENPVPTSNITIVRIVAHRALSVPRSVDTAGWLTYGNNSTGVQFRYPPDYRYSADDIQYNATPGTLLTVQNGSVNTVELRYFELSADMPVAQAFQFVTGIDPSVYQQYSQTVGGQKATVFRQRPGTDTGDFIYFVANSYLFEVPFNTFTASILSTFKFYPPGLVPKDPAELSGLVQPNVTIPSGNENTNAATADTTDWSTYTNSAWNFSFRYPKDWVVAQDSLQAPGQSGGPTDVLQVGSAGSTQENMNRPYLVLWMDIGGFEINSQRKHIVVQRDSNGALDIYTEETDTSPDTGEIQTFDTNYGVSVSERMVNNVSQGLFVQFRSATVGMEDAQFDTLVKSILATFTFTK